MPLAGDPGGAPVVVNEHGIVRCRRFGVDGDGKPVTCDTPFAIASLTKSVTAVAIVRLAEAKKVELDAPVSRYLPYFRTAGSVQPPITIRDLLLQRSGFDTPTGLEWFADPAGDDGALERRVRALAAARLNSVPGTRFTYSNANYSALGAVIAAVNRTSYERAVETLVFRPLGIEGVSFNRPDALHGYTRWFGRPLRAEAEPVDRADVSAAGMVASAASYGRYLAAQVDAGRGWSRAVLSPAGWALLHRAQPGSPYAMGWYAISLYGANALRHNGEAPDFRTYALIFPQRRIGLAVFVNADEAVDGGRQFSLERGIAALASGRDPAMPERFADLWPRVVALTAFVALLWSFVARLLRRRPSTFGGAALRATIDVSVLALLARYAFPAMGYSFAVGWISAPDLTAILAASVVVLLADVGLTVFDVGW
ncbi:MAG TPA: serine hydrolase domain-containing protein, partial [Candidatus Baltobacteraceae bacterium]|nr:serine hydrolase domain-containing protein [Candidatus Baltobacteraceae bacterium]